MPEEEHSEEAEVIDAEPLVGALGGHSHGGDEGGRDGACQGADESTEGDESRDGEEQRDELEIIFWVLLWTDCNIMASLGAASRQQVQGSRLFPLSPARTGVISLNEGRADRAVLLAVIARALEGVGGQRREQEYASSVNIAYPSS